MANRILIVDDNPAVRAGIRIQLNSAGMEICGEAVDGLDALIKAAELSPDLIVLDLSMPRMNGIEAARELKRICPRASVILHTLYADAVRAKGVMPEGVSAVIGKGDNLKERVLASIHQA
jgi:DNA-binding NarL/FixJ family response regulator